MRVKKTGPHFQGGKGVLRVLLTVCILFLLLGILPIHGEEQIYQSVLRLHVLANSDSAEDQALKLQVRDAVLEAATPLLEGCTDRADAITRVGDNLARLEDAARRVIVEAGREDPVRVTLSEEVYPTKAYEGFCFPSGEYASLRVMIGDAEGQNWWCVLFPPLCVGAATEGRSEEACVAVGLTGEQYRVITETDRPTYVARFRILEVFEEAARKRRVDGVSAMTDG